MTTTRAYFDDSKNADKVANRLNTTSNSDTKSVEATTAQDLREAAEKEKVSAKSYTIAVVE